MSKSRYGVAHSFPWALGYPGQGDENGRGVSSGCELITSKCSPTAPNQIPSPKRKSETRFDDLALRREFSANVVGLSLVATAMDQILGIRADGCSPLGWNDLLEEENFYWSLRTTLAKSTQEQEIFDELAFLVRQGINQTSSVSKGEEELKLVSHH